MSEAQAHRAGFVAIVGRPNVGKSTLMNQILGQRVAITTPKPQTTRDRIRGVRTFEDWQVVYVDTPGIHEASTKLNRYMVDQAVGTLGDVDLVYLLIDAPHMLAKPDQVMALNAAIAEALAAAGTPTLAVINKADKVASKLELLPLLERVAGLHPFEELIAVSALTGDGVERLLALTRPRLPEGPALFPEDTLTDRSLRFLAAEMVREQLFMRLKQELPYNVAVRIDHWEERDNGIVAIHASIHVARKSHKAMVIGKGGAQVKDVGQRARASLEAFLERRVYLDLHVRVEEGWTDRVDGLRKLGYSEKG